MFESAKTITSGAQDEWPFINGCHCQWPIAVYRGGTSAATAAKAAAAASAQF